jgi:LTXXQ motif family protein
MTRSAKTFAILSTLAGLLASGSTLATTDDKAAATSETKQEVPATQAPSAMPPYGPGYGMGMMGGYGPAYGMMGGRGPGRGMMRGYGPEFQEVPVIRPGYGLMGPFWVPDLTSDQIDKMQKIRAEWMEKMQPLMQQVWQTREKLADMYASGDRDPAEIGKVFSEFANIQRQAIETRIDTQNRLEALLTPEQRQWEQQEWLARRWR